MNRYLIRLDDACPTMDIAKWQRMEDILNMYGIRPMVGVIPHNEDERCSVCSEDPDFWLIIQSWVQKGWTMAMHGYSHVYSSEGGLRGLNPLWERSEFAGYNYKDQCEKIKKGYAIMKENGIEPQFFFAPSHTYDETTLDALRDCTPIRMISDTIATKPYRYKDFTVIPQLGGHCMEMKIPGMWTFCFHPNVMDEESFVNLENFLKAHQNEFIGFDDIDYSKVGKKSLISKLLSYAYFTQRRLRGIK